MDKGAKQYHIEGLRGLAIILIVLFHASAQRFPMGYLGVDIFLVISGYLLFLRPIQRGEEGKLATSWNFIKRKAGRIMWPLIVATAITLLVSFFILVPGDLRSTAKTARCALLCFSNTYLGNLKNGGYFAPDASFNLMVPSWYVSLTCQVYLFFLLGWLIVPRKWLKVVIPVCIVLSLAFANFGYVEDLWQAITGTKQRILAHDPSYYSFWTRIWEVLAGGLICVLPSIRSKIATNIVGIASLIGMAILFCTPVPEEDQHIVIPLMVIASILGIRYAGEGLPNRILTNPVFLWFGKISFSIYLIHMLVIGFMGCLVDNNEPLSLGLTFACAVVAGLVFYYLVEKKKVRPIVAIILWVVTLVAAMLMSPRSYKANQCIWNGVTIHEVKYTDWKFPQDKSIYDGMDGNILKENFNMVQQFSGSTSPHRESLVMLGDRTDVKPSFVLIGDSHSASFFYGFDAFACKNGLLGVYFTPYVMPLDDWMVDAPDLKWSPDHVTALINWLDAHPEIETVVIVQRWFLRWTAAQRRNFHSTCGEDVTDSIRKFIVKLHKAGKKVVVSTSAPELRTSQPSRSYCYYTRFGASSRRAELDYTREEYDERVKVCNDFFVGLEKEGLCRVLHLEEDLFVDGKYEAQRDGCILMCDSNHMSVAGSRYAAERYNDQMLRLLVPEKPAAEEPAPAEEPQLPAAGEPTPAEEPAGEA